MRMRWALLAGCALWAMSDLAAAQDWQAGAGPDWAQTLEAARREGQLVVTGSPDMGKPMTEGFQRDTGLKVLFVGGAQRDISSRVEREVRAKNLTIDIVIGGASDLNLVKEGYGEPIKPQLMLPDVLDPKKWQDGALRWVDTTQSMMFQGAEYVYGQPFLNMKLLKAGEIQNWKDMLKPEYRGKITAMDPRQPGSGQATAAYLAHLFGLDFLRDFYIGQKPVLTGDARQAVEWGARGLYPIVIGGSPTDLETFKAAGIDSLAVGDMLDGPGTTLGGFSVIWQPKGNPHPAAARVFLNWYASRPGQIAYIASKGTPTRRTDIDVSGLPDYLKVKPGKTYLESYNQEFYLNTRVKLVQAINEALGAR